MTRSLRTRLVSIVQSRIGPRVRGRIEAEDIVQETFLRAYRAIGSFEWQGDGSFTGWLTRIAEHLIWNASQKHPRAELTLRGELTDTATSPEKRLRRNERFDRLEKAMAALNPEQREAVRLSRIERLRITEIAERLGKSPGAVKMALSRALRKLRATFGETESLHLPDRELPVYGLRSGVVADARRATSGQCRLSRKLPRGGGNTLRQRECQCRWKTRHLRRRVSTLAPLLGWTGAGFALLRSV